MERFVWSEEYSLGIATIDDQHKYFFELTNQIIDLVNRGDAAAPDYFAAIDHLGTYALYHLGTEEGYFKAFEYKDAAEHVEAHNIYRDRVQKLMDLIRQSNSNLKEVESEIVLFTVNWLTHHIKGMDRKYVDLFKEHGVK